MRSFLVFNVLVLAIICLNPVSASDPWDQARKNASQSFEAIRFCRRYANGWLGCADPKSGLLPRIIGNCEYWNARDCAADNFPFLFLTAHILDDYHLKLSAMHIFEEESRLTPRVNSLSDTYYFDIQGFQKSEPNLDALIFDAAEYSKDGLLPITEWMGKGIWSNRMEEMISDIWKHAEIETKSGILPSLNTEVNGDLLEAMSRLYWMTGNQDYRKHVFQLADYYLIEKPIIKENNLRLRDHGSEIIGGLSEAYIIAAKTDSEKKERYRKPIHELIDCILKYGANEDGLLFNGINPQTGEITDKGLSDGWGYVYNAILTIGEIDHVEKYRNAVQRVLENIHKYKKYSWEGNNSADGYADSIEGAINLVNRFPVPSAEKWIDEEIKNIYKKQGSDGIIESWYGDGNSARTALMYALWKTQGICASPWRDDLELGAVCDREGRITISLRSKYSWKGRLNFDRARHNVSLQLPFDYPRINQFPEWFTVTDGLKYNFSIDGKPAKAVTPEELESTQIALSPGVAFRIEVTPENIPILFMRRKMKYSHQSRDNAISWQKKLRSDFFRILKIDHFKTSSIPLDSVTLSSIDKENYTENEIEFNSTSNCRIRAIVTIPKIKSIEFPAVVCIHGHGGNRRSVYDSSSCYNGFAAILASEGYVTISCDVGQHEIREQERLLMGERLWDLMRCVDFLESMNEVDKRRIGCAGLSLGGEMGMWLGALDTRISVVVVSGFLTVMDQMEQNHCMCWKFEGLRDLADFSDIYSLIAPRPLQCQNGKEEPISQFPVSIAQKAMQEIKPIYEDMDCPGKVELSVHPGGHIMDIDLLKSFLQKHLKVN